MTGPLVFIDTETTGLDERPGWDGVNTVWEVGLIRRAGHYNPAMYGQWSWQLRVDPGTVDPAAAKVNRFHERYRLSNPAVETDAVVTGCPPGSGYHPGDQLTMPRWAELFVDLVAGGHWAGIVPDFDVNHLVPLLTANGQLLGWPSRPWHYHLIDPESMAAGLLGLAPPWHSYGIAEAFGITIPERDQHTALGDARHAEQLYEAVQAPATRMRGLARSYVAVTPPATPPAPPTGGAAGGVAAAAGGTGG